MWVSLFLFLVIDHPSVAFQSKVNGSFVNGSVICFPKQSKWLGFIWNATLGWNELMSGVDCLQRIYFHYLCFIGPKGGKGRTSWSLEIWFSRKSLFKKSLGLPYDKLIISSKTNFFACKDGVLKINLRSSFHLHLIDAGNHENDFSEIFIKNNDFWSMRLLIGFEVVT